MSMFSVLASLTPQQISFANQLSMMAVSKSPEIDIDDSDSESDSDHRVLNSKGKALKIIT